MDKAGRSSGIENESGAVAHALQDAGRLIGCRELTPVHGVRRAAALSSEIPYLETKAALSRPHSKTRGYVAGAGN